MCCVLDAGNGHQPAQDGLRPQSSPANGDTATMMLATDEPRENRAAMPVGEARAATVSKSAAPSVTAKITKGARILLRGRDEDLGIDAVGNMVRPCVPPGLLTGFDTPTPLQNHAQVMSGQPITLCLALRGKRLLQASTSVPDLRHCASLSSWLSSWLSSG